MERFKTRKFFINIVILSTLFGGISGSASAISLEDCNKYLSDLKAYLDRTKNNPFIKRNWALDASGADLLRNHSPTQQGHYTNSIGILDTGLRTKNNPAAGAKLIGQSPELLVPKLTVLILFSMLKPTQ